MPAENQHIRVEQGDSKKVIIPIQNQQDSLKPLNLAGSEVIWEVYQEPYHKLLLSKTSNVEGEITITSASEGVISIIVKDTDTSALKLGGDYSHYVRVKDTFGQKSTVTKGKLFIEN